MRGAVDEPEHVSGTSRIIPAHAGSSLPPFICLQSSWDHPRACGEQMMPDVIPPILVGSSPRMRGADVLPPWLSGLVRIIPAHAGSSRNDFRYPLLNQDHPRACGEQ